MASLPYVSGCASSGHWASRKLGHSSDKCIFRVFSVSALFCHSPPLQAQGLTESIARRSWANWEIFAEQTSLLQPHVGECVQGVLRGTSHLKEADQQTARHEAPGLAEVWLLRGSAQFEGAEGTAGPAGRGVLSGIPEQRALGGLEMEGLLWPQLQKAQIAAFQNSLGWCTSVRVLILRGHHMVNFHGVLLLGQQKCFVWSLQRAPTPNSFAEVSSPSLYLCLSISAQRQLIHGIPFVGWRREEMGGMVREMVGWEIVGSYKIPELPGMVTELIAAAKFTERGSTRPFQK